MTCPDDLPVAVACGARHAPCAGGCAGAAAFGALFGERDVHRAHAAENGLVEVDVQGHGHVLAALRGVGVLASAASAAEHVAEAAEAASAAEERAERAEDVVQVSVLEVREVAAEVEAAWPEVHALMAELVVALALFGV